MAERGGYQRPANPAPVSGPGALSARTDGGPADKQPVRPLPNAKYGEGAEFAEAEAGAPMREQQMPQVIPLDAPSGMPDVPVTAGADAGDGPGSYALGIPGENQGDLEYILPQLKFLQWFANQPNAAPSTREFIRRVKAEI